MLHFIRRSLLVQLLSVYLLFVIAVLIGGVEVNTVVAQQLRTDAQASDQALAQEIAVETSIHLSDSESSLVKLGNLARQASTPAAMASIFQTYQAARPDVEQVYWLDPVGDLRVSWPPNKVGLGAEFSPPDVVQRALTPGSGPVFEVGIAVETTFNPGIIIADPVHTPDGQLVGIVAASLSLIELSDPLTTVVQAQQSQSRQLMISIIDNQGRLIATPESKRLLQTVLDELPGANQALQGNVASNLSPGSDGQNWLFSAVPVPNAGWAVVVQRPAGEALAIVGQFQFWLLTAALLFAIGGLLFWLMLLVRVIRPLHTLAIQHQALPTGGQSISTGTAVLAERFDEVGHLAQSLMRLERDGLKKLGELHTLLETSNVVVGSLDPHAVVGEIIREVRRLVDVQAAALLLPDEHGVLRVLESSGHSERYNQGLSRSSEDMSSAAALALSSGKPVQKLLAPDQPMPSLSYDEGFRAVLAIPIISRYAGGVVLLVHRTEANPFNQNEINLLLTFANYATLAWEHAILYERSDERLHEVALENERLYRQAAEETQKLEAIMSSMNDGLVLTGSDGRVLYANLGASTIAELPAEAWKGQTISVLYNALYLAAVDPAECEQALVRVESAEATEVVVEIRRNGQRRAIHMRQFDVDDESRRAIGRGLLLRDVTRERELDEFKSTLLAAVGHELRTPLAAIKGNASTLLQEDVTWSIADQRHFLQTISGETDRLAQLVSNLLDLSRQEAGLLLLKRTPIRVQDLVAKTIEHLSTQGVTIALHIPDDLPLVNVDRARIEIVLHNLVANAQAYGAGEVRITAEKRNDTIDISVSDNGPGITSNELPHVFERFYRARRGRQQRSGGTGIGLAICKAFIEAHRGVIWAESSVQGTTISFSLPLDSQTAIAADVEAVATDLSAKERRSV
ncbi:MAG TPA: ATP-binding protein [Ktedonobacteraceae bacterium]|nr:ATP-binding protein [Ktedonobacteraceae bacterium]